MIGMICTNCYTPTGVEPDFAGLGVEAITALCNNWLCTECLDERDHNQAQSTGAQPEGRSLPND